MVSDAEARKDGRVPKTPYLRVGLFSLLLNVGLVAAKLLLSSATGSLALRADAVHSAVDIFGSIALIGGLVVANRRSPSFPYGLYKAENVVAVIISIILFVSAFEIGREAVSGRTALAPYGGWVLAGVGALVLGPLVFSRYEIGIGRKTNSPSLVAEGRQFRADVLSGSIVFAALLGQAFGLPLDRAAAGVVAVFIARSGWGLLRDSMRVLLDASVDAATLGRIRAVVESQPEVDRVIRLTGRNSGRFMFIEVEVALRVKDLARAHAVSQRIEREVKDYECCVDRVLVHYEPQGRTRLRYAFPLNGLAGGGIGDHFGEAPFFILIDVDTAARRVLDRETVPNPYLALDKGRGLRVALFLLDQKVDVVVSRESLAGKGPGFALAQAGVALRQTDDASPEQFLGREGIRTEPEAGRETAPRPS
jgi:cation diffusion facilitator family transporter